MAKKSKLLSQEEIHALLKPKAEEIIKDVQDAAQTAIENFYNDPSFTAGKIPYERTGSFNNFKSVGEYKEIDNGYNISFVYSSKDVTVNPYLYFKGNPGWAFDADFVNGFHGGPRPMGKNSDGKIQWGWANTPRMGISPWEQIKQYVDSKYS